MNLALSEKAPKRIELATVEEFKSHINNAFKDTFSIKTFNSKEGLDDMHALSGFIFSKLIEKYNFTGNKKDLPYGVMIAKDFDSHANQEVYTISVQIYNILALKKFLKEEIRNIFGSLITKKSSDELTLTEDSAFDIFERLTISQD